MPSATPRTPSPQILARANSSRISTLEQRNSRPSKLRRQSTLNSVDLDGDEAMMNDGEDDIDEENQGYVGGGGNYIPQADVDPDDEEDVLNDLKIEDITEDTTPFKEGAIRRIVVENFLTYKRMEVNMGPGLNMIIGPNGTGKSSIVCAICLGLGWAPSVLGRAKDVGDFVKHGEAEGSIEIELQKRKGESRHPVIKRRLIKENNGSSWWINGAVSTNQKVVKLAKSYNIQIDNLCTFLPQDKVAEFAKITPPERLKATLRAAAPPEMLEMHETLCDLGKKNSDVSARLESEAKHLKQLEDRQKLDEAIVQRMRDREKFKQRIELLNKAKPIITYNNAHADTKRAKAAVKEEAQYLRQLEQEAAPELEKPEKKQRYKEQLDKVVEQRTKSVRQTQRKLAEIKDNIEKINGEISNNSAQIEVEWKQAEARKNSIDKLKDSIAKNERKIAAGPPDTNMTELNEQLNALREKEHQLMNESYEIRDKASNVKNHIEQVEARINGATNQLNRMNSLDGQREEAFKARNPDGYKLWKYIQQNRDKFQAEVFPPAIINCSIKNPQAMDAVEAIVGRYTTSFVSQNLQDYNTLQEIAFGNKRHGTKGLDLADINLRDYSTSQASTLDKQPGPRVPREQLRAMGFDGYCIDFLQGPAPVLNMMCHEGGVNGIPVALKPMSPQQQDAAERAGFTTYINGSSAIQIYRRYGQTSSRIQGIRRASIFKLAGVDTQKKSELERAINELKHEVEEFRKELKGYDQQLKDYNIAKQQIQNERDIVEGERKKMRELDLEYKKAVGRSKALKKELEDKLEARKSFNIVVTQLNEKAQDLTCKKAEESLRYAAVVAELVDAHDALVQMSLRAMEATSDLKLLEDSVRQFQRRIDNQQRVVDKLHDIARTAIAKGKALKEEVSNILKDCTLEETEILKTLAAEQTDLGPIEREIAEIEAQLSLLQGGQEGVLERYEKRARDIEKGRKRVEKMHEEQQDMQTAIDEVRSQWEPELEKLVDRVSRAFALSFSKIDCGGEVRIHRAREGFDKWAIDILVKFREEENMQVLDSHRQSGGERAVTTVFYLMALQSLAQSPFRVVDEINQGMDPRNERIVHHRMVNVACQENTSQYFLITPKLLSDLVYHPRMKVHCVYSGDWLESNMVMDIKKYLDAGRRIKAQKTIAAH